MIAAKKNAEETEELSNTLLHVIDMLLHAVAVHSVATDPASYAAFQVEIQKLRGVFRQTSQDSLLPAAAHARQTLEGYNHEAVHHLRNHARGLHQMLSAFTDTVTAISTASESSIALLRDLEKQTLRSSTVEEVSLLAIRVAKCLDSLRDQTLRQRELADQNLTQLKVNLERAPPTALQATPAQPKIDSLSGLPLRAQAERALHSAIQSGGHGFAGAFVLDRVHLINARFGYAVGDQLLLMFREHLARYLKETDQLFRWTGPVFLVLLDRPSLEGVRAEFKRLTSTRLDITVQIGARSVLLPVASSSAAFSLLEVDSVAVLIEKIDMFVAEHWRR